MEKRPDKARSRRVLLKANSQYSRESQAVQRCLIFSNTSPSQLPIAPRPKSNTVIRQSGGWLGAVDQDAEGCMKSSTFKNFCLSAPTTT